MDAYPGDLLAGVFPLVFAVNCILEKKDGELQEQKAPSINAEDIINDFDNQVEASVVETVEEKRRRSAFDRFLDAVAGSLFDEGSQETKQQRTQRNPLRTGSDTIASLLRGDEDDSSDEEDASLDSSSTAKRFRVTIASPALRRSRIQNRTVQAVDVSSSAPISTSYARSLKVDNFFQRARVLPVSTRHGFPPSKDPDGQENRALQLSQTRSALAMHPTNANALRLKKVLDKHPIDGILPSGWMEKHVHALPSVLIVVTVLQLENIEDQGKQDQHLSDTIEHLRESLAPKRECQIRLVCLLESEIHTPVANERIDEWVTRIRSSFQFSEITLLKYPEDLLSSSSGATSSAIKRLQKTLKDLSWQYYSNLMRTAKRKLSMLGHDNQPTLLPLAVRYCFKVAVFYEFLLKHHKSMRFFAEAYKHLQNYYGQLLGNSISWDPVTTSAIVNPQGDDGIEATLNDNNNNNNRPYAGGGHPEGVEVALADEDDEEEDGDDVAASGTIDIRKVFKDINPPPDMGHQCRAVADWLNFKLMQAGFQASTMSNSDDGLLAASTQWKRHSQMFMKQDDASNPGWHHWSFVFRQRHVMSQLVERFPPRPPTRLSASEQDEVMMRCSAWRNYMATAEAALRLGVEVRKSAPEFESLTVNAVSTDALRGRFTGSIDSEGLLPMLKEESEKDFIDIALEMLRRAVSGFELEANQEKLESAENNENTATNNDDNNPFGRSGARLYYLLGGCLLGKEQYSEATVYLEKAVKFATGWKGLELVIRRMLIECYNRRLPSQETVTDEQSKAITSMILDSYFNSEMSSRNLRKALKNFSSISGSDSMKWYRECVEESDASLPFSFSVTFPGKTHATAGDTVTTCVWIRSNLDYGIHVNSVTLLSMAGRITVPANALLSATNANEGKEGGIIMQAKTPITFSTQIEVPRNLDNIATDESGNGGEKQGTPGKGSFSKSARPRTAGISSAAGARLISEQIFGEGANEQNAQWSLRYLGGKPLRCDGICLVFYPVQVEKSSSGSSKPNVIELTITKKKRRTAANIKRTPFEEDNYVASAWQRPVDLHLCRGPRCLRVLGPMPQMRVVNITDPITDGKAIEGTVNRILFQLKAGPNEVCEDIKIKLSCSSIILCSDGTTKHLTTEENTVLEARVARVPAFVARGLSTTDDETSATLNEFGYSLPSGWTLRGTGLQTTDEFAPPNPSLKAGEETYIYFDIFRAHQTLAPLETADDNESRQSVDSGSGTVVDGNEMCQTDYDVSITYRQARPKAQQRTRRRRKPPQTAENPDDKDESNTDHADVVCLEHSGSVMWTPPLSAEFSSVRGVQKSPPSGSRHPSNSIDYITSDDKDTGDSELSLVDGERICTRCFLTTNEHSSKGEIELKKVWFEEARDQRESCYSHCSLRLVGNEGKALFETSKNVPARTIGKGKKVCVLYNVETRLKSEYRTGSAESNLGLLCVDWLPCAIDLPSEAYHAINNASNPPQYPIKSHGPLALSKPSVVRFRGPPFYIESAPFSTTTSIDPPNPTVGMPFQISFTVANNTATNQTIRINVQEKGKDESTNTDGILFSGFATGDVHLSPQETMTVKYTAVPTVAGPVQLPPVSVSSLLYKTWIVNENDLAHDIFVLP